MNRPEQICAALSAGVTRRFHCYDLLKPQSVGAHSWEVAMLVAALTGGSASAALLIAALRHDIGEKWTGDVPSPVKRATAEVERLLDELEASAMNEKTGLEHPLLSPDEERILKAADNLSGLYHCLVERQLGNQTLRFTFKTYARYICATEEALPAPAAETVRNLRIYIEQEYARADR